MVINRFSVYIPFLCACLSAFLHFIYFIENNWGDDLLSAAVRSDAHLYFHKAWFSSIADVPGKLDGIIPFSPYGSVLTVLFKTFGASLLVAYFANAVFTAGSTYILVKLTSLMYGNKEALVAGVMMALSGVLIYYSGLQVKTPFVIFIMLLSVYSFFLSIHKSNYRYFCVSIVLLVCASLDRENVVIALPLMSFFSVYQFKKYFSNHVLALRYILIPIVIFLSLFALIPNKGIKNSVGVNFMVANAPGASGGFAYIPGLENDLIGHRKGVLEALAEENGREPTFFEYQTYLMDEWSAYYSKYPLEFLSLKIKHMGALFAQYSYGHPEQYANWRWSFFATIFAFFDWSIVIALALTYLIFNIRNLSHFELFIMSFVVVYAASVIMFLVTERYRLLIYPFLIPMASKLLCQLYSFRHSKRLILSSFTIMSLSIFSKNILAEGPGWNPDHLEQRQIMLNRKLENEKLYQLMALDPDKYEPSDLVLLRKYMRRLEFKEETAYFDEAYTARIRK